MNILYIDIFSLLADPQDVLSNVVKDGEWRHRKINIWGVFKSFISQIKTGQDLTRISLPAELSYPYSMLEVMALRELSLFHVLNPINDEKDGFERFLGVIVFFLSMLRQETSEKKPWNPIIGETHFGSTKDAEGGDVHFYSEQVSHHPPVSAFYVTNEKQQMEIRANISFGVKFGGNSVTVTTTGGAVLRVLKFQEEYQMSRCIPDMLVKHVVWGTKYIIWKGECEIACKEKGYKCKLVFDEGSGRKNTIGGQITVNGNEMYTIKGVCGGEVNIIDKKKQQRLLVNVAEKEPANILYLPVDKLDKTSSVVVWGKVNQHVLDNDLAKADSEKMIVENEQRAIRKQREKDGTVHEPKYFVKSEEEAFWIPKEDFQIFE